MKKRIEICAPTWVHTFSKRSPRNPQALILLINRSLKLNIDNFIRFPCVPFACVLRIWSMSEMLRLYKQKFYNVTLYQWKFLTSI
jgi:hypothetical protein